MGRILLLMGVCVLGRSFDGTLLSWCEYRSMDIYRFDGKRPIHCKNLSLLHTSWCCCLLDNPNDSSSDCYIPENLRPRSFYCMYVSQACVRACMRAFTHREPTVSSAVIRSAYVVALHASNITSALSCNLLTYLYLTYLTYLIMEARTQYVYHFLSTLPEVHVLLAVNVTVRRCVR